MTHLLIAAEWDIRGGPGGPPGHHGMPGKGGTGGIGGTAYEWYSYLARFVVEDISNMIPGKSFLVIDIHAQRIVED
jgi:hypothetical protein